MNLGSVADSAINRSDVSERGVIEVEVPITGGNFVVSSLTSTSSSSFTSSLVEPVEPVLSDKVDMGSLPMEEDYDDMLININKGLASKRLTQDEFNIAKETIDYLMALEKYDAEMEIYIVAAREEAAADHKKNLEDLEFDLKTLKEVISKDYTLPSKSKIT